jgi:precorrin-6A/cobalt-precorrin-6A reductase
LILLLGGTGETAGIATLLAEAGHSVLVSTATDNDLRVGEHPLITRRTGRLDAHGISSIVSEKSVSAIVDATHPFAVAASETAKEAAERMGIPYIVFIRPGMEYDYEQTVYVKDHEEAAAKAVSYGKPVLLTTGSRNLAPYAELSRKKKVELFARVLPHPESTDACRHAGLDEKNVVTGRGPFSVEQNIALIKKYKIGTIVTKDSGREGGVVEKIEAARLTGIRIVMVERPNAATENSFNSAREIVAAVNDVPAHKGQV